MNALVYYISCGIYFYNRWFNGSSETTDLSFQATVLIGIIVILNRR